MAVTLSNGGVAGYTDYTDVNGYHKRNYYVGTVTADSVTRTDNTVKVTNVKIAYLNLDKVDNNEFGWSRAWTVWVAIFDGSKNTRGTDWLLKKNVHTIAAGTRTTANPYRLCGSTTIGTFSFNVGAGDTSHKFRLAASQEHSGRTENIRDAGEKYIEFTITFPANTVAFNVNVTVDGNSINNSNSGIVLFDAYLGNNKVGNQVKSYYNGSVVKGTTYKVNNIRRQTNNYYYIGSGEYSGTANSNTVVTLPFNTSKAPSGFSATLISRTWNSVTAKAAITNYGAPTTDSNRYVEVGIIPSNGTNYSGKYASAYTRAALSTGNKTITHANLKGGAAFKLGAYATNQYKSASQLFNTVYYLPPAPLSSVAVSNIKQIPATNDSTVTLTVTGGNNTNNNDVQVTTYYRLKKGGGDWTAWTSMGTGSPWTAKTATLTLTGSAAYTIQAKQSYQSQDSEIKEITYTSPTYATYEFDVSVRNSLDGHTYDHGIKGLTFDVYINGEQRGSNISDWDADYYTGTTYRISNIKSTEAKYTGPEEYSGTIGSAKLEISLPIALPYIYAAVNNKTRRLLHLYVGVDGKTKHIYKLYGSVDGKTKCVFTDRDLLNN